MLQVTTLDSGVIWTCKHCHIWWGSQVGKRPSTNLLMRLDQADLLPPWDAYRGWKLVVEQAPVCPECGRRIKTPALQSNQVLL